MWVWKPKADFTKSDLEDHKDENKTRILSHCKISLEFDFLSSAQFYFNLLYDLNLLISKITCVCRRNIFIAISRFFDIRQRSTFLLQSIRRRRFKNKLRFLRFFMFRSYKKRTTLKSSPYRLPIQHKSPFPRL